LMHPVYQSTAWLVVNLDVTTTSNMTSSLAAVPTYAQLVTNPTVLGPVAAHYPGMTVPLLTSRLTVKPQSNTQLIEVDVQDENALFATQLANEVSLSFIRYANAQLPGSVQLLPAQQPMDPFKPRPLVNTEIAALVSLALSIFLIIVFEWIDDHPASADEIRHLLETRLLAVFPLFSEKEKWSRFFQKKRQSGPSPADADVYSMPMLAEKYHMLCAGLTAALNNDSGKLVLVTSALAGEGKSIVAARLASFLAQTGKKVLLVDANLHRPVQAERFHVKGVRGLSQMLARSSSGNMSELSGAPTHIPNLHVLPAGYTPARPAELLQSVMARSFFELLKHASFDYVIIDAPPVLPVADAQIMATSVQTVLLVVDAHKTSRRALVRTREELQKAHATVLGVVVNKSRWPDYTRELEYPDDLEPPPMGDSGPVPAVFSTASLQTPPSSGRQRKGDARPPTGDTAFQTKGQP
jgi:succinoglycan biosynthesis transport protein ExoP